MSELVNPYLLGSTPRTFGGGRAAAVAIVGVAVVGGCGSTQQAAAPPTAPAAAPPTAPATAPPTSPPTSSTTAPPTTSANPLGGANTEPTPDGQYTVRRGNTLSGIAVQFKIAGGWPVLYKRNARTVRDPDLILVGQKLRIAGP